ncbi:MAG TPA: hypothetical protein VFG47_23810, partial [Geminicoccaceae bacterium]|nr:hypothetical protein [Geminicoccaceae bacterium]
MRGDLMSVTVCAVLACSAAGQTRADTADIDALVARKAAILETMHDKAGKALVRVAQDGSFRDFFLASTDDERATARERIEQISLAVQARFHVAEMCLIGRDGAEVARIVDKRVAHDLSPDETGAIFFTAGFALPPRGVHVSPLYMSVDADKWVVGYVTPIDVDGGTPAILHFEHSLAVYQDALGRG